MRKIILVAQENAEARKSLLHALEPLYAEGYIILTCMTGEEVLKKITLGAPSLIILDLFLTELNGFQVISKIKANPDTQNIPITVLTPSIQGIFGLLIRSLDVSFIVNRPTPPKKILQATKSCLEGSK